MAIYLEYEILKAKYKVSQQVFDGILEEKEQLFAMTQPKSVKYDTERVSGGTPANKFDEYLIQVEKRKLEDRLSEAKLLMEERRDLLKMKEQELRQSVDLHDIIYCCRVLDRMKMQKIMAKTNYSKSQIYRLIQEIYDEIMKVGTK